MTAINLPPALAARRAELAKDAEAARYEAHDHELQAAGCQRMAGLYMAEIAGIDAAAEAFAEMVARAVGANLLEDPDKSSEDKQPRRERRDIRGMVLEVVRGCMPLGCSEAEIAGKLTDVRAPQISNALAHHAAAGTIRHDPGDCWRLLPIATGSADEPALDAAG